MTGSSRLHLPPLALPFCGLFVFSGACGLVYEVVWSRLLVQVFGVTAFAVSTVLVSYMGGMALGATLLGRKADAARRPLLMFALLEAGVGGYALVLPLLLRAVDAVYGGVFPAIPDSFALRSAIRSNTKSFRRVPRSRRATVPTTCSMISRPPSKRRTTARASASRRAARAHSTHRPDPTRSHPPGRPSRIRMHRP